jgi:quercetin dioxygenase-like cupin family protein
MNKLLQLILIFQVIGTRSIWASSDDNPITRANQSSIVLKNNEDLKWEKMLPELGENSPIFSILRVDPKTKETTLKIRFPKALYIPKHTHNKSETHILLGGSHLFEHNGKKYEVKEHGYIYMPGKFIHEAWVPAGAEAIIILEDGWKVDWLNGGPTAKDIGKVPPL